MCGGVPRMWVGDPRMHGREILECGMGDDPGMCMEGDPKVVFRTLECVGADPRMHRRESLECRGKDLRRVE